MLFLFRQIIKILPIKNNQIGIEMICHAELMPIQLTIVQFRRLKVI